jgi:hypothetical protein
MNTESCTSMLGTGSSETWKAEIGRIAVWGQSGHKKFVRPHFKGKKAEWWHMPIIPNYAGGWDTINKSFKN